MMPTALPASRVIAFSEAPESSAPGLNGQLTSRIFAASHNAANAFCCFPPASPAAPEGAGKQKTPRRASAKRLIFLRLSGAGEGIRTLDPNLGKVVLYP
jgi:hypothetical protein